MIGKKYKSYLGKRGYILIKKNFADDVLNEARNELTVTPFINDNYAPPAEPFKVYAENEDKLYLPKYYGIQKFGQPDLIRVPDGLDIDFQFYGKLRENQIKPVNACLDAFKSVGGGILNIQCGGGKCLAPETKILMHDGSIKMAKDIIIGDLLMGDDSRPRKVLSLARGKDKMFYIRQENGDSYVVNGDHILCLKRGNEIIEISVKDYLKMRPEDRFFLNGYKVAVEFEERKVPFDPSELGKHLVRLLKENYINSEIGNYLYKNSAEARIYIPDDYKCNSRNIRMKLFRTIAEGLGVVCEKGYNFLFYRNNIFVKDFIFLCRSLGLRVSNFRCGYRGDRSSELYYEFDINDTGLDTSIFVGENGDGDYYGFEIDGNGRFLLADFTVTHNTTIALYLASQLKKKTLVIVHKEFLVNQWKERIGQFLPNATIGIIQQDKVDIENKDIVIAMLQSISMKEYALNTFDSMGFVVIDECHHIASQVFSRALRKLNSKYMLGLSATPVRKDGLTKVFKWYLGDIVYSTKHVDENVVKVERLIIKSNNEYYNKEEINYRGKPKMATMINNIADNLNRTKVIVYWIMELLKEDRKILVLSERRKHLEDINKLLYQKGVKSVGFYVGGMKEADLNISAKKSVILGTNMIAAEGLDIPGLDTLILTTPKSDIIQAVGRILRKKHEENQPKIIDFVDNFCPIFQGQAMKRNRLYRSRNWEIEDIEVWDEFDDGCEPKIVKRKMQVYKVNNKINNKNKENRKSEDGSVLGKIKNNSENKFMFHL